MADSAKLNLTMLCDFYELTMGNGYFENGYKNRICYFDVFFRQCPDKGGFAIAAGLEQIIHYIQDLHFSPEDIEYLRNRNSGNGASPDPGRHHTEVLRRYALLSRPDSCFPVPLW